MADIFNAIARTDRVLADLEDEEVARLNAALDASYNRLEQDLLTKYPNYTADAKPGLLGTQRAALLTAELKDALILINPDRQQEIEARYRRLLTTSSKEGVTLADELMRLRRSNSFVQATATIPIESAAFAAKDAARRLRGHGDRFSDEASIIISQGIIQGDGAMRVADVLRQRLGVAKTNAERIARTEIIAAQDSATRSHYKANGVQYVQRIATQDQRVCGWCAARAGNVYKVEEAPAVLHPFDRCFPSGTVVTASHVLSSSARHYVGQIVVIKTASGVELTCTPNHPILTDQGWVAAGLLNKSSYVLRCLDPKGIGLLIDPDKYQTPALIEEVAAAVGESGSVPARSVKISSKDFHGDGEGSKVGIIRTNRLLGDRFDAQLIKPDLQQLLGGRNAHLFFLAGSSAFANSTELGLIPSGMNFFNKLSSVLPLSVGHIGTNQNIGFGFTPNFNTSIFQDNPNSFSALTQGSSDRLLRFPRQISLNNVLGSIAQPCSFCGNHAPSGDRLSLSLAPKQSVFFEPMTQTVGTNSELLSRKLDAISSFIERDRVVEVSLSSFSGHVYNLETDVGCYTAQSIIVHNCYNMPFFPESEESEDQDESVKEHARDVQKKVKPDYSRSPFEQKNNIPVAAPVWSVKDGYLDPAVQSQGQNWALALLAAGLILNGRSPDNPEEPKPDPDQENQLLKALVIGAAIAGVTVGAYYVARTRYRAGFKQSAQMADFIARDIDLSDPGDKEQISFIAGGFAGMQGQAGLEYADNFAEFLDGHHMVGVPTPEFDKGRPVMENPVENLASNWSNVIGTAVIDGRNMSAVRMAAMAAAHYRKYGKPVNLIGYSGGGMVASEAHEILKELGIPTRTATLGTPWFGFTDLSPDEHIGFMGVGDIFAGLPVQNRRKLDGTTAHWLDAYTNNPDFVDELNDWFALPKQPQQPDEEPTQRRSPESPQPEPERRREPRKIELEPDTIDVDATLVDLVPQLALLSEDEIKRLPGSIQQKLLAARAEANLVLAKPTAIQAAQAKAALARLQENGIELTPIDLGEAVLETLTFLPAEDLAALPESIRRQIEGVQQKQLSGRLDPKQIAGIKPFLALPGYEPLLALPAVRQQIKGLLRGELPRLALPAGAELGPLTEIERQGFERQSAQQIYKQAQSYERSRSRIAEARIRERLREIARSQLPPGQKLAAYRRAIFDGISAIASPVRPRDVPGAANPEDLASFNFGGLTWYIPEFKEGSPSLDLIRKLTELELPDELLRYTNNIYISRQRNAAEEFWRKKLKLPSPQVPATANFDDGSITFYRGKGKIEDLLRQMGYQMAYKRFGQLEPPEGSEFRRAILEGRPITTYGFNSPAADFADSVAQFFLDPNRLKRFNPQRYNAIARMVNYRHPDRAAGETQARIADDRPGQILADLRTRNAELVEQSRAQRREAEQVAIAQRSTRKIQQAFERVDPVEIETQIEQQSSQIRTQEEALSRLSRRVVDLEQRSAQLLNPLNKPYFSEAPAQIRQTQRQLRAAERDLIALNRIGTVANRVRTTSVQLQQALGDLTTRRESLKLTNQGKQIDTAVTQLQNELTRAEQELVDLPRSPERSQALRDFQRLRAAINSQQGGISVADLHRQAFTPSIQQLSALADDLDDLQQRVINGRSRLTDLISRIERLPTRLADLSEEKQAQYAQIKRTRTTQGKLPQRVASYRQLRQEFSDRLAERSTRIQQLADNYDAQRQSTANNVAAIAEQRLELIRSNLQVLASLRPGSVAWLVDSRNWEFEEPPSDLAIILQRQPQGTRTERLRSLAQEIYTVLGRANGAIKTLNARLEIPGQIRAEALQRTQEEIRQWEAIRDALADENRLSDKQLQTLLKNPDRIGAVDVIRYGNQLVGDLETFNQDFVRLLLNSEDVDPASIRDQSELYRRARNAFLEETEQTRNAIAQEIEAALTTARALEQRITRDQSEPLIFEINGKARTLEDVKAELEQARASLGDFLKIRQVAGQVSDTEEELARQEGRARERDEIQARRQQIDVLRVELAEVNREIQKRREAAGRGQKRGIATARLEAQQSRILRDIEKIAREIGGDGSGE